MNQINPSKDDWQNCKTGELVRFASREKAKATRRRLILVGGVATLVLLFGVFLYLPDSGSSEANYGGIRCSAVRKNANAHLAGQLDASTDAKIAQHLKQCPLCAAWIKKAAAEQVEKNELAFLFTFGARQKGAIGDSRSRSLAQRSQYTIILKHPTVSFPSSWY